MTLEEKRDIKEYIKKKLEKMKENTTGNIATYETPAAFTGDEDDDGTQAIDVSDEQYAYSIKAPKERANSVKLHEASYKDFKQDESRSSIKKINSNILEVNKGIRELARMLQHSIKLKTEQKLDDNVHWKKTNEALKKMHQRISVLAEKANQLFDLKEATAQQASQSLLQILKDVGDPSLNRLTANDIDYNPVGTDKFEFDVMINGEPVAIDWDGGNLTYQGYTEEIPLGNIETPEEVIKNIQTHIL